MGTYTVSKLTKVSECLEALEKSNQEKTDLLWDKQVIEKDIATKDDKGDLIAEQLQAAEVKLQAAVAAFPALTDGTRAKRDAETEICQLTELRNKLINRTETLGAIAFLDREDDLLVVDFKLLNVDTRIAEITTRKTELESVA